MKKYINLFQLLSLFSLYLLNSCYDPTDSSGLGTTELTDEIEFTLPMEMPATQKVVTRAMDQEDENRIQTIDILLFQVNADQTETFAYHHHATNIENFGDDPQKLMKVRLKKSTNGEQYRIVLLANLRSETTTALTSINEGDLKEEVLKKIIVSNNGKWEAGSTGTTPRIIPMWGESNNYTAVTSTTTATSFGGTIYLLRAIAKVNIMVNLDAGTTPGGQQNDATDYFRIESVKLYNTRKQFYATPLKENYEVTNGRPKAILPSIYEVIDNLNDPAQMVYEQFEDNALHNEIYLAEMLNHTAQGVAHEDVFFLVFKAFYKDPEDSAADFDEPTWYRIDLYDITADEPNTHINILRNHSYNIVITDINGPGYPTEPEAENSVPINIDSEVLEWDDGDLKEVIFDGYYVLAVNKSRFELSRRAHDENSPEETNLLRVYTNYTYYDSNKQPTHGWHIEEEPEDFPVWLKLDTYEGMPHDTTDVRLLVEENTTSQERTFQFKIVAGRLQYIITVVQGMGSNLRLTVMDRDGTVFTGDTGNELPFFSGQGVKTAVIPNSLIVTWEPKDIPCTVTLAQTTGADDEFVSHTLPSELIIPEDLANGQKVYILYPPGMTAAELQTKIDLAKSSDVTFKVTDGTQEESVTVTLKQNNYAVWTDGLKNYYRINKQHSIQAHANAPWRATTTTALDPENIFDGTSWSSTGNGGASFPNEPLGFPIANNKNLDGLKGRILVTSTDAKKPFEDYTVEVMAATPGPNCYIIPAGTTGSIAIRKPYLVFEDFSFLPDLSEQDVLAAKVVWTDQPNLIESCVVTPDPASNLSSSSTIDVTPAANMNGNAVVALTLNGDIRWSWHIWVTSYDPDITNYDYNNGIATHTFMDRNLGAMANMYTGTDNSQTLGLYYQWGRKDPFPVAAASSAWAGSEHVTVYADGGSSGSNTSMRDYNFEDHDNNLLLAIENPTKYYLTGTRDWYTRDINLRYDYFWNDEQGDKAYFDPCPDGWRVPKMTGRYSVWSNPAAPASLNPNDYGNPPWMDGYNFTSSNYLHGYYPAAGFWAGPKWDVSTIYTGLNLWGHNWISEVIDNGLDENITNLTFQNGQIAPGNTNTMQGAGFERGYGISVRCVKE